MIDIVNMMFMDSAEQSEAGWEVGIPKPKDVYNNPGGHRYYWEGKIT